MPKYKLRPEFMDMGLGILHSIFPQITEATNLAKEVGFESPAPDDLEQKLTARFAASGVRSLSYIGGVIGAPLGFLPFFMDYYQYGAAQNVKHDAQKAFQPYRFEPGTIGQLYLRNYPDAEERETWFDDLKDQGWNDKRLDALKELLNIIPPLADMVRFADFGSFDETIIAKWKEFYDAPDWIKQPFSLLGITGEWANKYWFSHWQQPGRFELGELYRRGLIDDDIVKKAYLTQGFSSYWQDKLLELVKAVPTRVDVRRWWDMRTINEEELRDLYQRQGYFGDDLDKYVTWTKVYTDFPDLIARYKNGWITEDEVLAQLIEDGMPEDRAKVMLETKFKKPVQMERVTKERDLTKAEIVKGVKKEIIPWELGADLLQDMGYDEAEADYILDINIAAAGSPETPLDFRALVEKYKRSQGIVALEIPPELLLADKRLLRLVTDLKTARDADATQERIDELTVAIAEAKTKYNDLLALHELALPQA